MKLTSALFVLLVFACCHQYQTEDFPKLPIDKIEYIKDPKTRLCFAYIRSLSFWVETSMTCVPCDSLKNIENK